MSWQLGQGQSWIRTCVACQPYHKAKQTVLPYGSRLWVLSSFWQRYPSFILPLSFVCYMPADAVKFNHSQWGCAVPYRAAKTFAYLQYSVRRCTHSGCCNVPLKPCCHLYLAGAGWWTLQKKTTQASFQAMKWLVAGWPVQTRSILNMVWPAQTRFWDTWQHFCVVSWGSSPGRWCSGGTPPDPQVFNWSGGRIDLPYGSCGFYPLACEAHYQSQALPQIQSMGPEKCNLDTSQGSWNCQPFCPFRCTAFALLDRFN